MELLFLGTGAGIPSKKRNVTSIALKLLDEINQVWLFDCGEGTQHQILHTTLKPRKVSKVFITHLHGDHIYGLPGFLSSRAFQGGDEPLTIFGPKGIKQFVLTSLKVSKTYLKYSLDFVEIEKDGIIFKNEEFTVSCMELDHGIQSFGYRIEEASHPGMLNMDKVTEAEIPFGPLLGKLKKGETIQLEDGRTFNGKEFIGPTQKGRIAVILGDTRKTNKSSEIARDADILVHESTFDGNSSQMAKDYHHSTNLEAAEIAEEADVKKLLLTHISARYLQKDVLEIEKEAQNIFKNTKVVKDFDDYSVPLHD